jgi:hypothetical protein
MDELEKNEVLEQTEPPAADTTPPAPPVSFTNDPEVAAFIELKVQEGIQKALQGKPPRANTTEATEGERKRFDGMTYKERLKLYQTDPQTYNKLTKGA